MHTHSFSSTLLVALVLVASALSFGTANAAKRSPALYGNDISWPQCNTTYPKGQAFGIVGVNNGLANNTNPCFASQLNWATTSAGGTGQDTASLYVNTANPGLAGSWWPSSNVYDGKDIVNPYGTCDHRETTTCAYIYGYAKAYDDATIRGVINPSQYHWWLDVETINSWSSDRATNAADLEGMTAYFTSLGARVGLYSTAYQWDKIVGPTSPTSNLNGLQSWLAGSSQRTAQSNCSLAPLTMGGKVVMTQYVLSNLDYNYSCI